MLPAPPIVERLLRLSDDGVPLSGSSAGAMALCTWRVDLRPGRAPGMRAGLGLVPGAAAPHFDHRATRNIARMIAFHNPDVTFLGLADRTALIGRAGRYEVVGSGSCTVVYDADERGRRCSERTAAPVRDDTLDHMELRAG